VRESPHDLGCDCEEVLLTTSKGRDAAAVRSEPPLSRLRQRAFTVLGAGFEQGPQAMERASFRLSAPQPPKDIRVVSQLAAV
jgi:hypothetical protein